RHHARSFRRTLRWRGRAIADLRPGHSRYWADRTGLAARCAIHWGVRHGYWPGPPPADAPGWSRTTLGGHRIRRGDDHLWSFAPSLVILFDARGHGRA